MDVVREVELLERLANLLRSEARTIAQREDIQPVQLDILRYLQRANRYSDTPAAVAEYLNLTKGTVSQSILRLEERKCLRRASDAEDGRVVRLRLTPVGRRIAGSSWQETLEIAVRESRHSGTLADALGNILRELQRANGLRSFGVCHTCRHFEREPRGRFRCGLTSEPLSKTDKLLICREHENREIPR